MRPVPPRCGVLGLAALGANTLLHDAATLWAMAAGRVRPSMIHVVAWVGLPESSCHAPGSLCSSCRRQPKNDATFRTHCTHWHAYEDRSVPARTIRFDTLPYVVPMKYDRSWG